MILYMQEEGQYLLGGNKTLSHQPATKNEERESMLDGDGKYILHIKSPDLPKISLRVVSALWMLRLYLKIFYVYK